MAEVLLSLGGNVGPVRETLDRAVKLLCDGKDIRLIARSADYRTQPWGGVDQPAFVNLCLIAKTALPPHALLARIQSVEAALGRDRAAETRWGPRPIDIDIIAYGDVMMTDPDLTLPHPRWAERAFVLVPLAEIAANRVIAGTVVRDALARLESGGIKRLPSGS